MNALLQAFRTVAERHAMLSCRIIEDGNGAPHFVQDSGLTLNFSTVDLSYLADPDERATTLLCQACARPFDLYQELLWRAGYVKLSDSRSFFYVCTHHIVLDDWSIRLLLTEVQALLDEQIKGVPGTSVAVVSIRQPEVLDEGVRARALDYWRDNLAGCPVLSLPTDRPRLARPTRRAAKVFRKLGSEVLAALEKRAADERVSLFSAFLTNLRFVLSAWSHQTDFAIGVSVLNRLGDGEQRQIGLVADVVALRQKLTMGPHAFWQAAAKEAAGLMKAMERGSVSYDEVIQKIAPSRQSAEDPLIQAMFIHHEMTDTSLQIQGCKLTPHDVGLPTTGHEFTLMSVKRQGQLALSVEYDRDLFDAATIEMIMDRFTLSLEAAVCHTPAKSDSTDMAQGPRPEVQKPVVPSLANQFYSACAALPDAIALSFEEAHWSFRQLYEQTVALAATLSELGVGPEKTVAIALPRGCEAVCGLWASILTGSAVLPLDMSLGDKRVEEVLSRVRPDVAVVETTGDMRGLQRSCKILVFSEAVAASTRLFHIPEIWPDSLTYVLPTSGSSGEPKSVAATYGGLANRLAWGQKADPLGPDDIVYGRNSPAFVDFLCETFAPTLQGARLHIAPHRVLADPVLMARDLSGSAATHLTATPTVLRELAAASQETASHLKSIHSSGESLQTGDVGTLTQWAPNAKLFSLYGSCEVSADAMAMQVDDIGQEGMLGTPIAEMTVELCDPWLEAVPTGALGELVVSGSGLARGYFRQPAATAEVFIPNASGDPGSRAFKTGDLARCGPKDDLCFAGRKSGHVNIRGVRVSLSDVENALLQQEGIDDAAAVLSSKGQFYALVETSKPLTAQELSELARQMRTRVPAYLVPDRLVAQPIPRTPSGKTDYEAIRHVPPPTFRRGPLKSAEEQCIADVWKELLEVDVADGGADFFDLGGHSLLAARVARLLQQQTGKEITIAQVITNPVLADFAAILADAPKLKHKEEQMSNPDGPSDVPFDLTPLQSAYVVGRSDTFSGGGVGLHGYTEIEAEGLEVQTFERAVQELVERHDMLRAVLLDDGRQKILAAVPEYKIPVLNVETEGHEERTRLRDEMSAQVTDLKKWPSFDIRASVLEGRPPRFHISFDSTFVDAWSQKILVDELQKLLRNEGLPPLPRGGFRAFVQARYGAQMQERAAKQLEKWHKRLERYPQAPQLPTAETGAVPHSSVISQIEAKIPADVLARLRGKSAGHGSLINTLAAAYCLTLARWSANEDFLLNVPTSGRQTPFPDIDRIVGPFGDFTFIRFDARACLSFRDAVQMVNEELDWSAKLDAVSGMALSHKLMEKRGIATPAPYVFTSLNFDLDASDAQHASAFSELFSTSQTPQVYLDNRVRMDADGCLAIRWDVARQAMATGLPELMLEHYVSLLEEMSTADWSAPLAKLPVPERQLIPSFVEDLSCLGSGFWSVAVSDPDRLAIVWSDGELSYGALAAHAACIAQELVSREVGPGDCVVIALPKGPAQVAAVLAVARAGAAFVPLDPAQPEARLASLTASIAPQVVLHDPDKQPAWCDGITCLPVAVPEEAFEAPLVVPDDPADGADLAYVMFTSGSTGQSKGVKISRQAAMATITAVNARLELCPEDRVLAVSAPGFDLSVWDLFGTFEAGAAMVLPSGCEVTDPGSWLRLAEVGKATIWNSAPGLLGAALDLGGAGLQHIRWALLSGDFISLDLPDRLRNIAPEARFLSLGGATEAAIWSVWYEVGEVDPCWPSIPYGTALPGQYAAVVNEQLQLCPPYREGQIVIAGAGLADGYWGAPEETARKFILHPETGVRLYLTGDAGHADANGILTIKGRMDRQLKVGGHRLAPAEVEAQIQVSDHVASSIVVLVRRDNQPDRLVAHILRKTTEEEVLEKQSPDKGVIAKFAMRTESSTRHLPDAPVIELGVKIEDFEQAVLLRRSRRRFAQRKVTRKALGGLLGSLSAVPRPGLPFAKRLYGSAGNLYPVQAYLMIRPGSVSAVPAGWYYFDVATLKLKRLCGDTEPATEGLLGGANRDLYRSSAFVIVLTSDMGRITEVYPDQAEQYSLLEAGAIIQLLESESSVHNIGLCQVGGIDVDVVQAACRLHSSEEVLAALVGGPVGGDECIEEAATADAYGWRDDARATALWLKDQRVETEVREHLVKTLPQAFRPMAYCFWDQFPLTENGKTDHNVLAAVAENKLAGRTEEAPAQINAQGDINRYTQPQNIADPQPEGEAVWVSRVSKLWRDVLAITEVDPDLSFLELGGSSLQIIQMIGDIKTRYQRVVPVASFLDAPNVTGLAKLLAHLPPENGASNHSEQTDALNSSDARFPLTMIQQAYVAGRMTKTGAARSARAYFEVDFDELDLMRLERAVDRLHTRHEMLRVRFEPPNQQFIREKTEPWKLELRDLSASSEQECTHQLQQIRIELEDATPDLRHEDLFQVVASRLPDGKIRLHIGIDLIICDARSLQILQADLLAFYHADSADAQPALTSKFKDHVLYEAARRESSQYQKDKAYWEQRVAKFPDPPNLVFLPENPEVSGTFSRLSYQISPSELAALRDLTASHGVTLSATLCAAFARVLSVWSGPAPMALNLTTFGRAPIGHDMDRVVGDFTASNLLAINPATSDFASLAIATQRQILLDLDHGAFSGVEFIRALNRARAGQGRYEASVVFTSLVDLPELDQVDLHGGPDLQAHVVYSRSQTPQVLLDHQAFIDAGALGFNWDYPAHRFPAGLMETVFQAYCEFLQRLATDSSEWTSAL